MPYTEIPTQQEFKQACGRTGPRALFKTKKDLDTIFSALGAAEPHRKTAAMTSIPHLRKLRKACCSWMSSNQQVTRVSTPMVKDLCDITHKTINNILERNYGGRRLGLPEKPTLKDVINRAMEVKGRVAGPVGKTLDETYWIEKILPKHLGKGIIAAAFAEWKKDATQTRLNIADWLEQMYVPECEDDPFGVYIANRRLDLGKKILESKGVKYCTEEERKSYVILIKAGKVQDASGDIYDTTDESTVFSGKGWAIFVLAPDNTLYANSHKADEFHHSSFLGGAPIKCAGEIKIEEGAIKNITPKTGHYKAEAPELKYFLQFCQTNGVVLKNVQVCPKPFEQKKNWYPGDLVLLANGEEPTPDLIAAQQKKAPPVPPFKPPMSKFAPPVPPHKPPLSKFGPPAPQGAPQGVKSMIGKWEGIIADQKKTDFHKK